MSEKLKVLNHKKDENWYDEGVYFKCTGCGKCCTGSPGFVWLTEEDVKKLCDFLKISQKVFVKKYTRKVGKKYSLKEDSKSYDCIFLKDKKFCQVYQARPVQCRTFPYWLSIIKSKAQWEAASHHCEGINHKDAPLVPKEEIQKQLLEFLENSASFF